jgi:hypothetical protein
MYMVRFKTMEEGIDWVDDSHTFTCSDVELDPSPPPEYSQGTDATYGPPYLEPLPLARKDRG